MKKIQLKKIKLKFCVTSNEENLSLVYDGVKRWLRKQLAKKKAGAIYSLGNRLHRLGFGRRSQSSFPVRSARSLTCEGSREPLIGQCVALNSASLPSASSRARRPFGVACRCCWWSRECGWAGDAGARVAALRVLPPLFLLASSPTVDAGVDVGNVNSSTGVFN